MNYRTDMAVENMESDFKYDVNRIINGMNLKKIKVDLNLSLFSCKINENCIKFL